MGTTASPITRALRAALATLAFAAVILSAAVRPALADDFDGLDEEANAEALVELMATGMKATHVSLGSMHSAAILEDGSLWAWGYNKQGQLGDGTNTNQNKPVQVKGLSNVKSVALGGNSSAAVTSDGSVYTWGDNSKGQLGTGNTANRNTPGKVDSLSGATAVAMGSTYGAAIKGDGTLWMWGDNSYGQLGDGSTASRMTPVQVKGLTGVTQVALGSGHSAAIANGGKVMMWGIGGAGQLGNGSTANQSSPIEVPGMQGATQIALGSAHSAAVKDGSLYTWGDNYHGQLGNGSSGGKSTTPVKVNGLSGVQKVALGNANFFSAAIANGDLYAWGRNSQNELGNGNNANQSNPVRVGNLSGVQQTALGYYHGAAIAGDGTLWTWGANNFGQIGNGASPQMQSTPVAVSFPAASVPQKQASSVTVNVSGEIKFKEGDPANTYQVGGTGDGEITLKLSRTGIVEATLYGPLLTVKPLKAGSVSITLTRAETANYRASSKTISIAVTDASGKLPDVEVLRLYNPYTHEHLLTTEANEYATLGAGGWQQEGHAFTLPASSSHPIYRLYNSWNSDHLYTTSLDEYNTLGNNGWQKEGVKFYGVDRSEAGSIPVYRVYNPWITENGGAFSHLWTKDTTEHTSLVRQGWKDEGTPWYAMP